MVELAPEDLKADFKSLIRTFMFRAGHDYSSNVPIEFAQLAKDIFKDDSIKIIDDYHITKVFGNMARVVHHGPEYGVAIALSSTKIGKYEAINDANFTGWYQGDGMIYIYTDDMDYSNPYFKYANPYLMPGVTASATERKVTGIHPAIPNASNFAGGVEHGKYGAAGYTLGYIDGTLCNTFIDATNGWKITANKSYFMFDEEIICIGSAIKDVSGTEVRTVVENRFWNDGDKLYINGVLVTDPATYDYLTNPNTAQQDLAANYRTQVNGVNTMYFSNMGGYVFFDTAGDGNSLSYTKFNVTGDPSKGTISDSGSKGSYSFLEITLEHGTGNSSLNGSYYYAYLPEATTGQTEAYYVNPDVKLLSKSDNLHAVLERTLSAVGAVFFAGGTLNVNEEETPVTRIYSSTGAAVMISTDENGQTTVSVSDPTNSLASMTLEIDITGISELVSAEDGVNATVNGNTLKLSINSTGSCGATFDIVVK
jgi:hyaluronate lyase